jgi:hypothetical protein
MVNMFYLKFKTQGQQIGHRVRKDLLTKIDTKETFPVQETTTQVTILVVNIYYQQIKI